MRLTNLYLGTKDGEFYAGPRFWAINLRSQYIKNELLFWDFFCKKSYLKY